jgi:hypothetical protein
MFAQVFAENLDRDALPQPRVPGLENGAHPSSTEHTLDDVLVGKVRHASLMDGSFGHAAPPFKGRSFRMRRASLCIADQMSWTWALDRFDRPPK